MTPEQKEALLRWITTQKWWPELSDDLFKNLDKRRKLALEDADTAEQAYHDACDTIETLKIQLKLVQGNIQDRTELLEDAIKHDYDTYEKLKTARYQIQRAIAQIRGVSWNNPYQMRDAAQSVAAQLENYLESINEKPNKKTNV